MLRLIFKYSLLLAIVFATISVNQQIFPEQNNQDKIILMDERIKNTLVLGKITKNPKKHYKKLKKMVDYAVMNMKDLGILEGKVLLAKDLEQMTQYLAEGKVDWFSESVYPACSIKDKGVAEIVLKRWKKGYSEYHTVYFTRKDSGINSISKLLSKTIVFEDPDSTSAFFEPAYCLISKGYKFVKLDSKEDKPPPDKIGYIFSGQEINSSMWVLKNIVDIGVLSNNDWDKKGNLHNKIKRELKIIYTTRSLPRGIELFRTKLDPILKERLKDILLKAHLIPEGKMALNAYQKTEKFEILNQDDLKLINNINMNVSAVRKELE